MTRKYIDCREFGNQSRCTLVLTADTEEELLEAAVLHAAAVHNHEDTPELRQLIKLSFREGIPPTERPPIRMEF